MKPQNETPDKVTAEVIGLFNESFRVHDISILNKIVAENCVMETAMPAPIGVTTIGRKDCLAFWKKMIDATETQFSPEEITVMGEKAIIIWRYRWGDGNDKFVKGCTIVTVKNGLITEVAAYIKGTLGS